MSAEVLPSMLNVGLSHTEKFSLQVLVDSKDPARLTWMCKLIWSSVVYMYTEDFLSCSVAFLFC